MTVRKYYIGSQGPYFYDDTEPINDVDGDFTGETRKGFITDGPAKVSQIPSEDFDVIRFDDLGELVASTKRIFEGFSSTGTINYLSNVIACVGTFDLFLPTLVAGDLRVYEIKNIDFGIITLKPNASEPLVEIENELFQPLRPGDSITVFNNDVEWWVL
jgi:hypothetical protein